MRLRFLCTRQFQNNINESVYTLLKVQIARFGMQSKFRILKNKIICTTTGSEFIFYGLWRHIDEVKSMEGVDVHWSEEAHLFSEAQWEVLNPTLRSDDSQHWFIFNPRLATDYVWRRFVVDPPSDTVVRKINYDENPFLSPTIIKVIEDKKREDFESFQHIYLGVPKDNDEQSVIKRAHLEAAIDAHKKLGITVTGERRIGFDVADQGEDLCALVEAYGQLNVWSDMWKAQEDELLLSSTRAWTRARANKARIIYDAIGVGAGCGAFFGMLNDRQRGAPVDYDKFFASGKVFKPESVYKSNVKNKDFFANVKAQAWWLVADRLIDTYNLVVRGQHCDPDRLIFIDSGMPNLNKLLDELTTPKRDYDSAGRVKVESKQDMAKRQIPSPNLADAFIMANLPREMRKVSFFG